MTARIPILLMLLLVASCAAPTRIFDLRAGDRVPEAWLVKRTSIEELQERFGATRSMVLPESVAAWTRFKKSYRAGCEVWEIQDSALVSHGFTGYAILSDNRVVDVMGAFMTKESPNQLPEPTPGLAPGRGSS